MGWEIFQLQSILCHLFPSPSIPQKVPKTPSAMSLSLVICLQSIWGEIFATKSHCIWDMKSPKNLNDGTPITMAKQLECPRKLGSMVGIRVNNIPILHSWDIYWGENKPLIRSPLIRRSALPLLSSETRTEAIGRGTNFFGEENGRLGRSQQARRQFLRGGGYDK